MHPDAVAERLRAALGRTTSASSDYDLNPGIALPPGRKLRPAAVLVAVSVAGGAPRVLLTKRASHLKHHPGQIALPGGKVDAGDGGPEAAALREAHEEVGLPCAAVTILGRLPGHETVTGYAVVPILACITVPFDPVPEAGEVAEVFDVPLDHVTRAAAYRVESRRWRGQKRHYFALPFGPYYIWGATARVLRGLAERWEAVS